MIFLRKIRCIVIIAGGLVTWIRYPRSQPLEIVSPASKTHSALVVISGAVNCPGLYPLKEGDTLETLIQSAGGYRPDAAADSIELHIPQSPVASSTQKIDINRAEAWLLQALPGIGEVRAKAIVSYREQNGPFRHISEMTRVTGIGDEVLERLKDLISISSYE